MSPTPDGVSILSKNACCAKAPESAQSLHVSRWNLDRQNVAQVRIKEALHKLRMQRFAALVIKSCRRHLLQNAKEMQKASCRAMHSLGILEIDRFSQSRSHPIKITDHSGHHQVHLGSGCGENMSQVRVLFIALLLAGKGKKRMCSGSQYEQVCWSNVNPIKSRNDRSIQCNG